MKTTTNNTKYPLLGIFQALGDPIRLDIVACLLKTKERRITPETYAVAKSTLSHHIKILKDAGILQIRKEGVIHIYSLNEELLNNTYPEILSLIQQHVQTHH